MPKIYKYLSPNSVATILYDESNVGIKCTPLDEYNDPYEFFCPVDFEDSINPREFMLFYDSIKRRISGSLASCFTDMPTNIPMWAHYGADLSGFVLEFDTDKLKESVEQNGIPFVLRRVQYKDVRDKGLESTLGHACSTGKGRHESMAEILLWETAYFTKKSFWSYENEQRLLVPRSFTKSIVIGQKEIFILPVSSCAVTSVIAGPKMDISMNLELADMAEQLDANFFEMRIGRSTYDPFFIGSNFPYGDVTYLFQSGCLVECDEFCCECNEPTGHRQNPDYCFWCEIDDEVARENQDAIEAMRDLE